MMRAAIARWVLVCGAAIVAFIAHTAPSARGESRTYPRQSPFVSRTFPIPGGARPEWTAIAYGPHRDGQFPGGPSPTSAQIREDLHLIARHWPMLRLYGSVGPADTILRVIREEGLHIKVLLGAWIAAEERRNDSTGAVTPLPEAVAANRREVDAAVRLASVYPDIVAAIAVGNETQIYWSANRVPANVLIRYVREVRARTRVPVTTSDDYNFWNKTESRAVAREVDFVATHLHPLWNGVQLDDAVTWVAQQYAAIRAMHPRRPVVITETGWATSMHRGGEQGRLIKGATGETEQKAACTALARWARAHRVPTFFFEAFDENWKGGPDADDVEKHWGFYRADRTPKSVLVDDR